MEVGAYQEASSSGSHNKRRLFIASTSREDLEIAHVVFLLTFSLEFIDFYAW
ncbi:unnamed protein product [Spirodela intermedia]|uniref:Uncharacterized protein n=1 Tax=Spirodela intermedia TaxID=51605 RepID=A0ABN7ED42_SPIIN|nr:unnamed protein product [Spirodela intermedia]